MQVRPYSPEWGLMCFSAISHIFPTDQTGRGRIAVAAELTFGTLGDMDWLTFALVLITGVYAFLTFQMVREMQAARRQTVRPHLVLRLEWVTTTSVVVAVSNAGVGPALNVEATITFFFRDQSRQPEVRRWSEALVAPGGNHQFLQPGPSGSRLRAKGLVDSISRVTLVGEARDALGNVIRIDQTLDDFETWQSMITDAHERFVPSEPKAMRQALEGIGKVLQQLERLVGRGVYVRTTQDLERERAEEEAEAEEFWASLRPKDALSDGGEEDDSEAEGSSAVEENEAVSDGSTPSAGGAAPPVEAEAGSEPVDPAN
jgi:hypothetical protein